MSRWPFENPPNVAVITSRKIVLEGEATLFVVHDDEDGSWLFLTGGPFDVNDGLIATLRGMLEIDPSLAELADLPLGWQAWREHQDSPWQRGPAEPAEGLDPQG